MSPSFGQRKAPPVALVLLAVLALLVPLAGVAFGEGAPYKEAPGYPKVGCYDVATAGQGMWGGGTAYPLSLDVPGPVVDAHLVWIGTEDVGAPNSPNQSDLVVNGGAVVGGLIDQYKPGTGDPWWYMWRANVGPSGLNLVNQGMNKYTISGWNYMPDGTTRRNGVSLVVVYSTGMCQTPNQVDLIDNFDYYWERLTGTTDVLAFTFPPAPYDRDVTVWLHHAGSDHAKPLPGAAAPEAVSPSACRGMNLWAKVGPGSAPPNLVNYSTTPPTSANGGKLVVTDPFVGSSCGTTTWSFPVTGLLGWVDGQGWTRDVGGYIAPQWSIVRVKVRVRAGDTYVALQLESDKTGAASVIETGESGAWFAQAVIPLQPEVKLKIAKTDGVATAKPGDTLTYTIDYENFGNLPTADTTIVDTLPSGVTFVAASNGGAYDAATKTVKWSLGAVTNGAKGQVTVTVKLDPVFPAGTTTLTNKSVITTSTAGEVDTSDNTATDTTNVVAQAQLSIDKTAAPEPVDEGANLTYTVNWTVGGDAYSENVTIVDKLPANVSFVSATDGGVHDAVAGTVTWSLGNVTPSKSGTYTLVVKVNSPQENGTTVTNTVTISNKAGDTATDTTLSTVHADRTPVLNITKTNTPTGEVKPGDTITYEVCFSNTGRGPATNVVLTDVIPVNTTYVAGSATGGGTYAAATKTLSWKKDTLAVGEKVCGTFKVTVNLIITGLTGQAAKPMSFSEWNALTIDNTATVTADDLQPKSATVSNPLNATVKPQIYKSVNKPEVHMGDVIIFTVTLRNEGTATATNVVMTDQIQPRLEGVTVASTKGIAVYDTSTRLLTVTVGELKPDESLTVTITGRAAGVPAQQLPYTISNESVVSFAEGAPRTSNRVTVTVVYFLPGEIPEPGTWLLLGSGLAGLAGYAQMRVQARRRKRQA